MSYTGQLLRVDLNSGKIKRKTLAQDMQRKFLGSRGMAAKLLYDNVPPNVDPFDPENPLCFMTGPLTGTPAFGPGGYFATISPLTNGRSIRFKTNWRTAICRLRCWTGKRR